MNEYAKSRSSRRTLLCAYRKKIKRTSVRTRRPLFVVLLCAGLHLFRCVLSATRPRTFRSSASHKVAIATNTIVTVFGDNLMSEVLKELVDCGFTIDVFTCTSFDRTALVRSSPEVRIAFDPRFSKLSSKLEDYRALFSSAVHCGDELVPLMVDVYGFHKLNLLHAVVFNEIVHKDCSQAHFCPMMMMQERYLLRSWLYLKIFSSDEAVRLAKVVAGGASNHTLRKFAKSVPSSVHDESTIPSRSIEGRLQDLILHHDWDDHLPIGPFIQDVLHRRDFFRSTRTRFTCTPCVALHNCLEVCTAGTHMDSKPTEVSVYCSLIGGKKEREFLPNYVIDLLAQEGAPFFEVLVASADASILEDFRDIFVRQSEKKGAPMTVKTVRMQQDFGLYETWDYLISEISQGRFLTNWNVDDRKHRMSIAIKTHFLVQNPEVDVVSSAVMMSSNPGFDWQACVTEFSEKSKQLCEIWFSAVGPYSYAALVATTQRDDMPLTGSMNWPHNAPMYRKELHERYGMFSSDGHAFAMSKRRTTATHKPVPACYDWAFWLKVAKFGGTFYHLDFPLELYFMRKDSHNRRNQRETDECVSNQLSKVRNLGLYNNPSFWGFDFHQQYRWHRKIVVFQPYEQQQAAASPVKWLQENGHEVTIVVGDKGKRGTRTTKHDVDASSIIVYDFALFHILPSSQDDHEFEPRARRLRQQGVPLVGFWHGNVVPPRSWAYFGCGFSRCDATLRWEGASVRSCIHQWLRLLHPKLPETLNLS